LVGDVDWLAATEHDWVVAIGSSPARRRIDERLRSAASLPDASVLVHPTAAIGSDNRLAPGVVVGVGSVITTNVTLGRHTHVNVGCSVQHDAVLGDYVTVSPGVFVNGDVTIGDDVFLGTGAIVTRGCTVGAGATIGAGAVVLDDVAAGSRVVGVPARPG
jgi:sugar O-acyltransferase (sialic acid O-acetyltransferase NeuD family)